MRYRIYIINKYVIYTLHTRTYTRIACLADPQSHHKRATHASLIPCFHPPRQVGMGGDPVRSQRLLHQLVDAKQTGSDRGRQA